MGFVGRKLLRLILVVLAVTVLTFIMVSVLPGDVSYDIAGPNASPDQIEAIRDELGLNDNPVIRYFRWAGDALSGDFGSSFRTSEPVIDAILIRLPVSLELMILGLLLAVLIAVPAGVYCAYRAQGGVDRAVTTAAFAMISLPPFSLAIILILVFSLALDLLPATGYTPLSEGIWANLRGFILPAFTIALIDWAGLTRILRSDMIATLQEDYILMARSKGLPTWRVLVRHALRPSLFTLITVLGLQIGNLIGGTIVLETIFALPGVGRLLINAIFARDFMIVQGCILFIAVGFVTVNFIVDLLYSALDPRIRLEAARG